MAPPEDAAIAPASDIAPLIGLEIHVQLATRTKMFCGCASEFAAPPNTLVCPVCLGLPGALPVVNREAVRLAVRTALALGCDVQPFTKWDRKSYYYPDLPKNYQISQFDLPIGSGGHFAFEVDGETRTIELIRAHLEEDAGKNIHDRPGATRVDLNRAGTPLLEIVTKPQLSSAEEAYACCTQLQKLIVYLGVGEANMQEGQMRFEPNINLHIATPAGVVATPICEVKNLNSFRAVRDAVTHELERHERVWRDDPTYTLAERGRENRGWDDNRNVTVYQRGKEEAHDYRYFPDPDLVPVVFDAAWLDQCRAELPELLLARKNRLMRVAELGDRPAWQIAEDRATADLFDDAVAAGGDPVTLGKHFVSFWSKHANEANTTVGRLGVDASRIAELADMARSGRVNATAAASVAALMLADRRRPAELAAEGGLEQTSDPTALAEWVDAALAANPQAEALIREGGKKAAKSLGFLQGQVMRLSQGSADPRVVGELLRARLGIPDS